MKMWGTLKGIQENERISRNFVKYTKIWGKCQKILVKLCEKSEIILGKIKRNCTKLQSNFTRNSENLCSTFKEMMKN